MQPARPSFLEYFEQKEKENQINSFGKSVPGPLQNSSDWKVPQDGDYEFVSRVGSRWLCLLRKAVWKITHPLLSFLSKCKVLEHFLVQLTPPVNAPGSSSCPEGLQGLETTFWLTFEPFWGPSISGTVFCDHPNKAALIIISSLAIFPLVEFEIVNSKRNIQPSDEDSLSFIVYLGLWFYI